MTRDWDAATYDRIADPQTRWGRAVVDELQLEGDEVVLDAGCGSGRVTELLVGRLPRGRVIGLDASPAMLEQARWRLERFGDRVALVAAALAELGADPFRTKVFATPEETRVRLEAACFVDVDCWLHAESTPLRTWSRSPPSCEPWRYATTSRDSTRMARGDSPGRSRAGCRASSSTTCG